MDKFKLPKEGQHPKTEGTHKQRKDEFRKRAESSSQRNAELSDRLLHPDETEDKDRTEAINKGRDKMQKYQEEANSYKNWDKDTYKIFQKSFQFSEIKSERYGISVDSKMLGCGIYRNAIDIENGKIIGIENFHLSGKKLPFSEMVFNQLKFVMKSSNKEISFFDLKCWYGWDIKNERTKDTVKLFFPEETKSDGKIKEGRKTFKAGEDGFIALAGTPTAQSKFFLLAQHPKAFPGKEVTSITVIRKPNKQIDIEYQFGSKLEQEEKASPEDRPSSSH